MMVVTWTRMLAGGAPSLLSAMASQVASSAVAAAGRPRTAKGEAQRSCAVGVETVLALVQSTAGMAVGTVKTRIHRAKGKMRKLLAPVVSQG